MCKIYLKFYIKKITKRNKFKMLQEERKKHRRISKRSQTSICVSLGDPSI
jgi:hypothetical protein